MHVDGISILFSSFFILPSAFLVDLFDDQSRIFFFANYFMSFVIFFFSHVYARICTTWPSFALNCSLPRRRDRNAWRAPKNVCAGGYLNCLLLFITSIKKKYSFSRRRFIHKNCSGQFLSPYFLFYKFSPWIRWRLPFVVNAALTQEKFYLCKLDQKKLLDCVFVYLLINSFIC